MWASRPHHVVPIVVEVVQVGVGVGVMVVVRSLLLYDVIGTPRWWWWTSRRAIVTAGPCHVQVTPTERLESFMNLNLILGTVLLNLFMKSAKMQSLLDCQKRMAMHLN